MIVQAISTYPISMKSNSLHIM